MHISSEKKKKKKQLHPTNQKHLADSKRFFAEAPGIKQGVPQAGQVRGIREYLLLMAAQVGTHWQLLGGKSVGRKHCPACEENMKIENQWS